MAAADSAGYLGGKTECSAAPGAAASGAPQVRWQRKAGSPDKTVVFSQESGLPEMQPLAPVGLDRSTIWKSAQQLLEIIFKD